MDMQKEREAFLKWHYQAYLLENPEIDISNAQYIYDYAHKNVLCAQLRESHFAVWQAAKAQAVPETKKFNLDEFLSMEQKLKSKGGIIKADLDRFIAYAEMVLEKAKANRSQNDH